MYVECIVSVFIKTVIEVRILVFEMVSLLLLCSSERRRKRKKENPCNI